MNYLKYIIDNRGLDSRKLNPYSESLSGGNAYTKGGFWKPNSDYWKNGKHKNTAEYIGTGISMATTGLNTLNKGVHNATGDTLNTLGDAAMAAPPPYGLIAGGILKTAGFIANGFTNTINELYRLDKLNEIANYGTQISNASSYESLVSDLNSLLSLNVELGDINLWGSAGVFSSGSKRKAARAEAERSLVNANNTRLNNIDNTVENINTTNTENQLANLASEGGILNEEGVSLFTKKPISLLHNKVPWKLEYKSKNNSSKNTIKHIKRQVREIEVSLKDLDNILKNGGQVEITENDRLKKDDIFEFAKQEELDAFIAKHNLTEQDYIIE